MSDQRQVALVTGSSSGIGRAIALRLARDGIPVAVTARADPRYPGTVSDTVDEIRAGGGCAEGFECDLSVAGQRRALVRRVEDSLGEVTILVNNAAVTTFGRVADFVARRAALMHEVQVLAPFELAQSVLPGMQDRKVGWILNITSPVSRHPVAGSPVAHYSTVYAMCKAALERFTTGLAAEVYDAGIDVNALYPQHLVRTPGASTVAAVLDLDNMPTESPELMAEAARYLCMSHSRRITGRILSDQEILREAGVGFRGHVTLTGSGGEVTRAQEDPRDG